MCPAFEINVVSCDPLKCLFTLALYCHQEHQPGYCGGYRCTPAFSGFI